MREIFKNQKMGLIKVSRKCSFHFLKMTTHTGPINNLHYLEK